ncbi:MAG: zf-HC2 domain-containing protein [Gemmatimonadaceae bacterium]|nr:zf-HC2 domain-containing protein [Gemmatimonadaceae bacterium]
MDCREFRQLHGDWADDVLDPRESDRLARHVGDCPPCARFDTLARRALLVARNAPQIEVSADFSARLHARIAEERRQRIAHHAPSHAERSPMLAGGATWVRRAAVVTLLLGGSAALRTAMARNGDGVASITAMDTASFINASGFALPASAMSSPGGGNEIVVVRPLRQVGGALLPVSDDPMMDGADMGDPSATSLAATAPLWPTAQMAAHAANRFAAMEFGDVITVGATQIQR